jgi:hypothetical protein
MRSRQFVVFCIIYTLLMISSLPMMGSSPMGDTEEDRGPGPLDASDVWTDSFDDMGHVYVPGSGLVGVEVAGGEVRLASGDDEGWIASAIIPAMTGYRYDFVRLDAWMPGNSMVQISILNASKESSEIGFANETILGFKKVNGTYLSLNGIAPKVYPKVRIQVNLVADGVDRPVLRAWSLYFVPHGEWRDDFLDSGKMTNHKGLNFTGDGLELNLSIGTVSSRGNYDPYPLIAGPTGDKIDLLYANGLGTGYEDPKTLSATDSRGACFADLDWDGHLDLVVADRDVPSTIYWSDGTGTYSTSNKLDLDTDAAVDVAAGDINGDGWLDLAFGCVGSGARDSSVYLNQEGTFSNQPDIVFTDQEYWRAKVGDLNADGYDDILFGHRYLFYSGADGPDTTVDVTLGSTSYTKIRDIDQDGILDILGSTGYEVNVFLGNTSGIETTPDYTLTTSSHAYFPDVGDLNGDGYLDIVTVVRVTDTERKVNIFEGAIDGWSSSRVHDDIVHSSYSNTRVVDIDLDGYDDILFQDYSGDTSYFKIFKGGITWPTTADTSKVLSENWQNYVLAIDKGAIGKRTYRGHFISEPIDLPQGKKWDMAYLAGTTPLNTSFRISVLDEAGRTLSGYQDIDRWDVDLKDVSPTHNRTIRIKVTIESELNWTTPVLDGLLVKWMDEGTWRDEFYGDAKIDRLVNTGVSSGALVASQLWYPEGPQQVLLTSTRGDSGYNTRPVLHTLSSSAEDLNVSFDVVGTSAADAADVDDDGYMDVLFAVHRTEDNFTTSSPLFLGHPAGVWPDPTFEFPTVGATDVILEDINLDGHMDVVFAQEYDGTTYVVNSTLFWGKVDGWNATPDVEFSTYGASGLVAEDLDKDGDIDLAFSCWRDDSTRSVDSLVFLQKAGTFTGASPDHRLPTHGARGVDAGDIDGDDRMDLVFANSFQGGLAEVDSYVYWGKVGGGFETTPTGLRTLGAEDVKLVYWTEDNDPPDIVFANNKDNQERYSVDSYIYIADGSRTFNATPDVRLPTVGAAAIGSFQISDVGATEGVVFACQYNGTSHAVPSLVYYGGGPGTPWILPTEGASGVLTKGIMPDDGTYMSRAISPTDVAETGSFHTFRYNATLTSEVKGTVSLIDATTWEVLAETPIRSGTNEWVVDGLFSLKDHPSVRVLVACKPIYDLDSLNLDDLWLNWSTRSKDPPVVLDLGVSASSVYRTQSVDLWLNVSDEYDLVKDLVVTLQHRLNGTGGTWETDLLGTLSADTDVITTTIVPQVSTSTGLYDFRVKLRDTDMMESEFAYFPNLLEVLNNIPTAPEVRIVPSSAVTTVTLNVEIVTSSIDIESTGLQYRYRWFKDGVLEPNATSDGLSAIYTSKGQNWTVQVWAYDGEDEGLPAFAWRIIENTPPVPKEVLPDPWIDEDTTDESWINLMNAFEDPDGDLLTWTVNPTPLHIEVSIDQATGKVTFRPEANWNGQESLTFIASDGEGQATQTVTVTVVPVNDIPRFGSVNGDPVTGDTITFTIKQGELLTIDLLVIDPEGDELIFSANTSLVNLDSETGAMSFQPDNDAVGTLRFGLTVWDVVSPNEKITLNFEIEVENENDVMDDPRITNPQDGDKLDANKTFSLIAICTDPDTQYGQVLNYSWSSNISGHLGYGSSLTISIAEPGVHQITLTVNDGEFEKTALVGITIDPEEEIVRLQPNGGDDKESLNYGLIVGIIVVLVIAGAGFYVMTTKRRTEEAEAADEEEYKREHMERAHEAVKAAADHLEAEEAPKGPVEPAEIEIETSAVPSTRLSMEAKKTKAADEATMALFADEKAEESVMTEEEREELQIENLKRTYQNAIGRLPYGIPSAELQDWDWVDLAAALATGEKRMSPEGQETTKIYGRWYYSDAKDTGSFLKEHGAKPKAAAAKKSVDVTTDKEQLLAKLEERFILGEISEEAYNSLLEKYGKE